MIALPLQVAAELDRKVGGHAGIEGLEQLAEVLRVDGERAVHPVEVQGIHRDGL